jgi:hypothetical protein
MYLPRARRQPGHCLLVARLPIVTLVLAVASLMAHTTEPVRAQEPSIEQLRDAAGAYARSAYPRLANLVATEEYRQQLGVPSNGLISARLRERRLKSEVLLVRHPAETSNWLFFRDVLEVDGKPVPGHQDRLTNLFISPTLANWQLVREIAHADRQYHLPGSTAAETNPFVVVALMDRSYWPRLLFKRGRQDKDVGPGVWRLELEEAKGDQEPILARGLARGTVWVEAATGRILQSEVRIGSSLGAPTSRTTFHYDEALQVAVPVDMKTTWSPGAPSVSIKGSAKDGNFRQFAVRTDESRKVK